MGKEFDPSGVGVNNGKLFGFPYELQECDTVVIPVPWDVTVSYSAGTSEGPEAILEASPQLDFYDVDLNEAWTYGIGMDKPHDWILTENSKYRDLASQHIHQLETEGSTSESADIVEEINKASSKMVDLVKHQCLHWIQKGKQLAILGGDHSSPLGLMLALGEQYEEFGILQIDAHADLRDAYEGFQHSHASIMYNAKQIPSVSKIVQVGIRDLSPEEMQLAKEDEKLDLYHDQMIHRAIFEGRSWDSITRELIQNLPQKVYISFDIDGLDPKLCPNTGTPVPGGFTFQQVMYLIRKVVESGREIIGFDLCEVAPGKQGEWDANVGARVLYRLNNFMNLSKRKARG